MFSKRRKVQIKDSKKGTSSSEASADDNRNKDPFEVDYDPYEHRNKENTLSNFEAYIILVKGTLGAGIMSIPYAFSVCGYLLAIVGLVSVVSLFLYATHILIRCMYVLCKEHQVPLLSYADAMRLALRDGPPVLRYFSKFSVIFVDGLLVVYHFCVCIVYVVFIAIQIQNVIDDYIINLDARILMVVMVLPLIPIFSIRSLKTMVPMWGVANCLHVIGYLIMLYYFISELPTISRHSIWHSPERLIESFGLLLYSLQSVGTMLPVEAHMKHPAAFLGCKGLLVNIYITVFAMDVVFGLFGYWRYGVDIETSVTFNLPELDVPAQVVRIIIATSMYLSYPLQASVVINNVWFHWLSRLVIEKDRQPIEFVVRMVVVLFTVILAVCLVNVTSVVAVTGSFCITTLGIVLPAVLDICIRYQNGYGRLKWILIKDIALILLGLGAAFMGSWAAVKAVLMEM